MGFRKEYDEMADRYMLLGDQYTIVEDKKGSLKFGLYASAQFVDLKQGGDTLWIVCTRIHTEWHWVSGTEGILLIDGNRFPFVGNLMVSDTFWSEATWLSDSELQIFEEVHIGCDPDILTLIAESESGADVEVKVRLNQIDFTLPPGVIQDLRAMHESLKDESYGDT